jgi:hypothetical protein
MARIGFIGLGIMGAPMAGHLINHGHEPVHCTPTAATPAELLDAGAKACASTDVIIIMVPDTPHVEAALFGENGVAEGLSRRQGRGRHELDLARRDQGSSPSASRSSAANTSTPRCPAAKSAPRRPA